MNNFCVVASNRLIRLIGNIFKMLSYPFHFLFPKKRFEIPSLSKAKVNSSKETNIPRIIWQTNFSAKSTLPVYMNYLFNRLMSLNYEYRYVSTEERAEFMKKNSSKRVYNAYMQLNDGAAQADLWRLVTIHKMGGIYMDIDATLVWPLKHILPKNESAMYVKLKKNDHYTNFFLASSPNNPDYAIAINDIVENIENRNIEKGVYFLTGPMVITNVLENKKVFSKERKYVCIQGTFTNEHFQYLDKPRSKWTHKKPEDLLKRI
ncbi:glycosyltransferase family 32 protein [Vibrio sp. 10N.261.46.E12]|uniref:glycosyltransferase family 32 protein n=1 Tax=unclassified Vibrio TaxID=2614977 RepID=UPI00097619A6|nr:MULTISPECIES: glycosyltransferase [unclassified Vibrio]OMO38369.1 glycosyl transferase [Vibrio sp. 10N.261.45.E1]PMJ26060.1 glycosyl transferase [Vibrio sp. 10N.286.45.B6]PML89627.1 glycosyl transferase [Vibrio sp. 10N.261.49.E11]PMM69705.1 glycosyl transferase [Vibrio sp. 10N.261.46.F12]PMM90697.1 glycosyl transferase [Vibrio sp. 10N.261.46.E8]